MRSAPHDLRPLLVGPVQWSADGADVNIGPLDVHIAGDPEQLRPILDRCDGRTSVAQLIADHGPRAGELVAALLDRDAVVDAEHAWRVLHRDTSVGFALGRGATEAEVAALQQGAFMPRRRGDDEVALQPPSTSLIGLTRKRASVLPEHPSRPAGLSELAAVLFAAYATPVDASGRRAGSTPSAGALYPLAIHVLLREPLGDADPGLWWFEPQSGHLVSIRPGVHDADPLFVPEPTCMMLVARRQPIVFLSADLERPSRQYGARAYRYGLMETGAAMQSACLAASELDLPIRPIGAIDDAELHRFLDLPDTTVALLALLVGS